jgi:hypothetical protein
MDASSSAAAQKISIYQSSFDSEVRTRGCRRCLRPAESELPVIMINFACPKQESGFMAALRASNQLHSCAICHIHMDITDRSCLPHSSAKKSK